MNNFRFVHNNINVFDLDKSLQFYSQALGLVESRRIVPEDGSFIIVYLSDGRSEHLLELTWLKDWEKPYELGDNEFHIAFKAVDFDAAKKLHEEMGCICYINDKMGIYFIEDPDGYWIEILPESR